MKPESGWYVNEALLTELFEEVPTDPKKLEKKLCDIDIREYGDPCLSNCMNKEVLNGPVVLQLIRYRNVSQPKVKEDVRSSSDVARLSLTDGHTSTSALLLENIKGLNSDTPPGTKLLITGTAPVENGFVILAPRNVVVIGGRVEKLIEKWTIERHSLGESQRSTRSDCKAPKWISFGKRSTATFDSSTKNFKANAAIESTVKKDSDEKDNFEAQRKEIIDAVEEGSTKVFSVPKIQPPPRPSEPNVTRPVKAPVLKERGHDRRSKKGRRRGGDSDDEEVLAEFARPSKPSTLFDFMASNVVPDDDTSRTAPRTSNNGPVKQSGYSSRQQVNSSSDARNKGDSNCKRTPKPEREQRRLPPQSASYGTNRDRNEKPRRTNTTTRENYMENNRPQQRVQKSQQRSVTSPQYTARSENYSQKSNGFTNNRNEYPPSASSTSRSQGSRRDFNPPSQYPRELLANDFSHMRLDGGSRRFESKKPFPSKNNPSLNPQFSAPVWKVGDRCKAPWNDGMYYSATIVNLGPADMCAVRYDDYGNIGTVPQAVLLLV
nr:Domain of unknown function DUF1767 domain containing protein [Haemonchus contortus]